MKQISKRLKMPVRPIQEWGTLLHYEVIHRLRRLREFLDKNIIIRQDRQDLSGFIGFFGFALSLS